MYRLLSPFCVLFLLILSAFAGTAAAVVPVDEIADGRFWVEEGSSAVALPYLSTHDLDQVHPGLTRILIMIHGSSRRATKSMASYELADSLHDRPTADHTLVVCPQFLKIEDLDAHQPYDMLFWWDEHPTAGQGWQFDQSAMVAPPYPRPFTRSSFELLAALAEKALNAAPDASVIVFDGFSAGGKAVQHFALVSDFEDQPGVPHVVYLPISQAHQVFLGPERPVLPSLDVFAIPRPSVLSDCPAYNTWPYGLDNAGEYFHPLTPDELLARFANRHVLQHIGVNDTLPLEGQYSISCEAILQGGMNRMDRMHAWWNHVEYTYGYHPANFRFEIVEGFGHNWRIHRTPDIRYALLDHLAPVTEGEELDLDLDVRAKLHPEGDSLSYICTIENLSTETRDLDVWFGLMNDPDFSHPIGSGLLAPGAVRTIHDAMSVSAFQGTEILSLDLRVGSYPDVVIASQFQHVRLHPDLNELPAQELNRHLIETRADELPRYFTLQSISPNPFNGTTSLRFSLPAANVVRAELIDMLGRQAWQGPVMEFDAGWHVISVNGSTLPSGVYLARLSLGSGEQIVRKAVLLR